MASRAARTPLIQLRSETRVTLKETRRVLGIPPGTIERWVREGLLIRGTKRRVFLDSYLDGKFMYVTVEGVERFHKLRNGDGR